MSALSDAVKHIQLSADNESDRQWGDEAAAELAKFEIMLDVCRRDKDALHYQLSQLKAERDGETEEFNAGYTAAQNGEPIENEPAHCPYDVWKVGCVWGKYQMQQAEKGTQ